MNADPEIPEDRTPCPVTRELLMENFTDGQWWTVMGMSDALGSKVPNELAMRYYRRSLEASPRGSLTVQISRARQRCIMTVLSAWDKNSNLLMEDRDGVSFYKILPRVANKNAKVGKSVLAPTAPSDTVHGLTQAGILAVLRDHKAPMDFETLLKKIDHLYSPGLLGWYRKYLISRHKREPNRASPDSKPEAQLIVDAKRYALSTVIRQLAQSGHITDEKVRMVKIKA